MKKEFFSEALEGIDEKYLAEHIQRKHPTTAQKLRRYAYAVGAYAAAIIVVALALPFFLQTGEGPIDPAQTVPPVQTEISDTEPPVTEPHETDVSTEETATPDETVTPDEPEPPISSEASTEGEVTNPGYVAPTPEITNATEAVTKNPDETTATEPPATTLPPEAETDKIEVKPPIGSSNLAYSQTTAFGCDYSLYIGEEYYTDGDMIIATATLYNRSNYSVQLSTEDMEHFNSISLYVDGKKVDCIDNEYGNYISGAENGNKLKPWGEFWYTAVFDTSKLAGVSGESKLEVRTGTGISAETDGKTVYQSMTLSTEIPCVNETLTEIKALGVDYAEAEVFGCKYTAAVERDDPSDSMSDFTVVQTLTNTSSETVIITNPTHNDYLYLISFYIDGEIVAVDPPAQLPPNPQARYLKPGESISYTKTYSPTGEVSFDPNAIWEIRTERSVIGDSQIQNVVLSVEVTH